MCCYWARGIFAIDVLLMMGWLYSFGGNAILVCIGWGAGAVGIYCLPGHDIYYFGGCMLFYGLVQNEMMLLVLI